MVMYPNLPKPNEEFRCNHCGNGAVEFAVHNIYKVDNFNQKINERIRREIRCEQCGALAVVVALDPSRVIDPVRDANPNTPVTVNETFVKEEDDGRSRRPINIDFLQNSRTPVTLRNEQLTPLEEFKKKFKGF